MSNLSGIRRLSRVMAALCLVAMVAMPLLLALAWALLPSLRPGWPPYATLPIPPEPARELVIAGFLVLLVPLAVLLWGVERLRRLFRRYEAGDVFSPQAARCLAGFAQAVLLWALLQPLASALAGMILTLGNPPGQRALALSVGTGEPGAVAIALVLLVVARVLREASRVAEENASFV